MKVSLMVSVGKAEGKVIAITTPEFIIGRDPQCHLRPASPIISKKHCALIRKDSKAFIHDFNSTNGTFLNEQPVKGQRELKNGDQLRIGPLSFVVQLEVTAQTPAAAPPSNDEEAAAMLLGMGDDNAAAALNTLPANAEPESTILDLASVTGQSPNAQANGTDKKVEKPSPKQASANTSSAAEALLARMRNRK